MNNFSNGLKNELLARREQLRGLTNQSKIQGDYHESLIREFILRFIDKRLSVKHGLIINDKNERSGECDVIIYENEKKPLFESGETVIVNEEDVRFVIQVKSKLTSTTLKLAINNLQKVKKLNHQIMCWIVGFETKLLFKTLYLNARRSGVVNFLHAFHSDMEREDKSLLDIQMESFVNFIRQCGDYSQYCYTGDLMLYKKGKFDPALVLTEDDQKNKTVLSEIYSKGLSYVLKNEDHFSSSFERPME